MRKIFIFSVATLLTAGAFAEGEVYRWKASDGTWAYSDQPRPGAELISGPIQTADGADAAEGADQPAAPPVADAAPAGDPGAEVSDAVAAEVRAEVAAAKVEQCKKAEEAYQKAITARRITRTDEKGNTVYLNSAEIDAARLKARANRDLACSP
jgi:hypothetical protein